MDKLSGAKVYTDFSSINQLHKGAKKQDPKTIKAVSEQFEAMFLEMALKQMRAANRALGKGLFSSDQMDLYQDLSDKQMALHLSNQSRVGLAKMIQAQLSPHLDGKSPSAHGSADPKDKR